MRASTLKVAELREELKKRGADTKGLKAALVSRLQELIDAESSSSTEPSVEEKMEEVEEKKEEPKEEEPKEEAKKEQVVEDKMEEVEEKKEEKEEDPKVESNQVAAEVEKKAEASDKEEAKPSVTPSKKRSISTPENNDEGSAAKKPKRDWNSSEPKTETEDDAVENKPEKAERILSPASNTLCVSGFVRPFTLKNANLLMEKYGKVTYFWMNGIRSKCYVVFETQESAVKAQKALDGLCWPKLSQSLLCSDFSTEEEARKATDTVSTSTSAPSTPSNAAKEQGGAHGHNELDSLFKKTKTTPAIYYLPRIHDNNNNNSNSNSRSSTSNTQREPQRRVVRG